MLLHELLSYTRSYTAVCWVEYPWLMQFMDFCTTKTIFACTAKEAIILWPVLKKQSFQADPINQCRHLNLFLIIDVGSLWCPLRYILKRQIKLGCYFIQKLLFSIGFFLIQIKLVITLISVKEIRRKLSKLDSLL